METRWMKRKNENGEEEKFYPITHAKAVVYGDDGDITFEDVENHLKDTNNPHGLDAEDVGAMRVYKTLDEIGVTTDVSEVTMTEIINALPNYSELITRINSSWNSAEFPDQYATLHVIKHDSYERCFAYLNSVNSRGMYYGSANSGNATFSGWKQIFTTEGGTLTGNTLGLFNGSGLIQAYAAGTLIGSRNPEFTKGRYLNIVHPDTYPVASGIYITEGDKAYLIYGEHNKPTPADIGAKPAESTTFNLGGNYVAVRTPERTSAQYYEFWDNNVGWADIKAREFYAGDGVNKVYHAGNKPTAADIGAAASSHNHSAANITSGTLSVARGGTGATTFTSGAALIGAGTGAVTTRAITNNTSTSGTIDGTSIANCNTLKWALNRSSSVAAANQEYTGFVARGIALSTSVPSSLTNGCVTFVYA